MVAAEQKTKSIDDHSRSVAKAQIRHRRKKAAADRSDTGQAEDGQGSSSLPRRGPIVKPVRIGKAGARVLSAAPAVNSLGPT